MADRIEFQLNGEAVGVDAASSTPLLFALRDHLEMRGTRHGCAEGDCGACTVLVDGKPTTSCNLSVDAIAGCQVETIESLDNGEGGTDHPLVDAFMQEQAGQCGYCLAGILMRAKALLAENPRPDRQQITRALDDNLCRCGAHNRIIRAISRAADHINGGSK